MNNDLAWNAAPQLNVPLQSVPEEIGALFDPTRPIPADVRFERWATDTSTFVFNLLIYGLLVGGAFGCSGIFGLITLTVSLLNGSYTAGEFADIVVYVVVYGALIGLVIIAWRSFWTPLLPEWLALQEQRAHTLRRGYFLTPQAMIVRVKTDSCDILPRDSILSIGLRGRRYKTCYVVYRASEGKRRSYDLSFTPLFGRSVHHYELYRLQRWAGVDSEES
jgi:hypothetical protein